MPPVQPYSGIGDAPQTGETYGRNDGEWVTVGNGGGPEFITLSAPGPFTTSEDFDTNPLTVVDENVSVPVAGRYLMSVNYSYDGSSASRSIVFDFTVNGVQLLNENEVEVVDIDDHRWQSKQIPVILPAGSVPIFAQIGRRPEEASGSATVTASEIYFNFVKVAD